MNINAVINALRKQGHLVETYDRPDGGKRIIRIDGQTFSKTNSKGNNAGRAIIGTQAKLTKVQIKQRQKARDKIKTGKLTKAEQKRLKEANKRLKKLGKKKIKKVTARRRKRRYGSSDLEKAIGNRLTHAEGISYVANVEWFIALLRRTGKFERVIGYLGSHKKEIKDTTLTECHNLYYEFDKFAKNNPADSKGIENKAKTQEDKMFAILQG